MRLAGLTQVVELPIKGEVLLFHYPIPTVSSSLFLLLFPEQHWKICGMALLILLEVRFDLGFGFLGGLIFKTDY